MKDYSLVDKEECRICYYLDCKLHRLYGPAIEWFSGTKEWYQNGKKHRLDGPAYEPVYGRKQWWIEGRYIECSSQEEFERYLKLKSFW